MAHGSSVSSNVYAYDIDGDSLTFALTSNAANGTLVFNGDGSFTYTPDINYSGPDSFSFSASDGINPAVTATVSFDVTNDPPMAYDFSLATIHDQSISSSASGYDMDGDSLTYSVISGPTSGSLGAASMDPSTGAFTYTPNPGYVGSDSIVYEVSDGLDAATATIAIDVTNDPPIAYDGSVTGAPGEIITGNVGGYDMDGDTLTYSLVTGPALGSLGAAGIDPSTGAFTYEPTTAFVGADSFVFQVFDGIATATAT
ncbi:MAG: tandem-95 repeat protein, partial [Planctomycetales bacterium]|nr:tandem-95 repeat protein [Planctomycetales bacterium]